MIKLSLYECTYTSYRIQHTKENQETGMLEIEPFAAGASSTSASSHSENEVGTAPGQKS